MIFFGEEVRISWPTSRSTSTRRGRCSFPRKVELEIDVLMAANGRGRPQSSSHTPVIRNFILNNLTCDSAWCCLGGVLSYVTTLLDIRLRSHFRAQKRHQMGWYGIYCPCTVLGGGVVSSVRVVSCHLRYVSTNFPVCCVPCARTPFGALVYRERKGAQVML